MHFRLRFHLLAATLMLLAAAAIAVAQPPAAPAPPTAPAGTPALVAPGVPGTSAAPAGSASSAATASPGASAAAATPGASAATAAPSAPSTPELAKALADLKVPPAWYDATAVTYDLTKPWKEARMEVRRLLGLGGENQHAAVKITWTYVQQGDPGAKSELAEYLFQGGEFAWAIQEYVKSIPEVDAVSKGEGSHDRVVLAACYRHYGANAEARAALEEALNHLPVQPWANPRSSNIHDRLGDILADTGQADEARREYGLAITDLETSQQPYGKENIPRQVAEIRAKIAMADAGPVQPGELRDGTYSAAMQGYIDKLTVEVTVTGGKIASVTVQHKDNIEQGAAKTVPARIVEKQSPRVDGVTGATITSQAIMAATYEALRQAGMNGGPAAAPTPQAKP